MAFATVQDLANYLQDTVTNSAATIALNVASGRIISAIPGSNFARVQDDRIVLRGGSATIVLPQKPVISVSNVLARYIGDQVDVTVNENLEYVRYGNELVWIAGGYVRINASPRWPVNVQQWPEMVTITYTHGYATVPDDVKGVCLMMAAELYSSPDGIGYESIDDYAWRRDNAERTPAALALKALVAAYGRRAQMVWARS